MAKGVAGPPQMVRRAGTNRRGLDKLAEWLFGAAEDIRYQTNGSSR